MLDLNLSLFNSFFQFVLPKRLKKTARFIRAEWSVSHVATAPLLMPVVRASRPSHTPTTPLSTPPTTASTTAHRMWSVDATASLSSERKTTRSSSRIRVAVNIVNRRLKQWASFNTSCQMNLQWSLAQNERVGRQKLFSWLNKWCFLLTLLRAKAEFQKNAKHIPVKYFRYRYRYR